MNDPPTALVGFQTGLLSRIFRLSMNNPPTALVGFMKRVRLKPLRVRVLRRLGHLTQVS
jgi:hypothetical protein